MIVLSIEEFAAKRRGDQDELEKTLFPFVSQAIEAYPVDGWYNDLLAEVARDYLEVFRREGGRPPVKPTAAEFADSVRATLDKTKDPDHNTVERLSVWLATAILNAGTQAAADTDEEFLLMEWVTMHDKDVRPAHRSTDGQQRPVGEPFDVGGVDMRYPGDPSAPIDLWINCRCSLAPVLASEVEEMNRAPGSSEGVTMTATETEAEPETIGTPPATPWHGVLAPEGVWSGDGRRFAEGALTFRDLPLPLTWQKTSDDGHKGSVTVGKIETIERVGNLLHSTGMFLSTPEADEVVGLIAEFGKFGVSVDADDAEMEFGEGEDEGKITFTSARISSASVLPIPAFAEAFVALGTGGDGQPPQMDDVCDPESENYDEAACMEQQASLAASAEFVSDKPWSDFTQADYTDEQWYRATVLHRNGNSRAKSDNGLPIREPGGALNRNGVHAAAGRFNQTQGPPEAKASAKRALRGAYKQLGEEPPDVLKSALMETIEARRGPGWVTNPEDTRRLWAYWTQKGQPGYAKINWGVPGDFNRCRTLVGEKIAQNSPEDMRYLNQICAQWHHDALGWWPGRPTSGEAEPFTETTGTAVHLVASAGGHPAPSAWFQDPHLDRPTPLTVTEDGQVYGHLAAWGTCHTGFDGVCIEPPHSETGYAYFLTGEVTTDQGPVPVGQVTLGGGHAPRGMKMRPALEHYDSTSSAVCDVTAGEDEHGIWLAGMVRPGTTDEQVHALRASPLSGDWRKLGAHRDLELIAALAVNVQGFTVPRVGVQQGQQVSLVAAGMLYPEERSTTAFPFDLDDLGAVVAKHLRMFDSRRARMAELVARVGGARMSQKPEDLLLHLQEQVDEGTPPFEPVTPEDDTSVSANLDT